MSTKNVARTDAFDSVRRHTDDGAMTSPADGTRDVALFALRPLRHACASCGTCCHGWRVRLRPGEHAKVEVQGSALGIPDPIVEGNLRQVDGHCVFLDASRRCRIHAAWGEASKPSVCQHYPRRATLVEEGLRVGVDPSCTNDFAVWSDGPEVEPLRRVERTRLLGAERQATEQDLLGLLAHPGLSIADVTAALVHAPTAPPELPVAFAARALTRLKSPHLAAHLADPRHGELLAARLAPVMTALDKLTVRTLPVWAGRLEASQELWVLDTFRRHLFLRLGDPELPPLGQLVVMLAGAFACAWTDPRPAPFAASFSAWHRVVRSPPVWGRLVVDTPDLKGWLTGAR